MLALATTAFLGALLASIGAYTTGDSAVRPWTTPADLTPVDVPIDTVRIGTLALPVTEPAQLVTQLLTPAPPLVPTAPAAWLLALLAVVVVGYLAVLPGLGWRTFLVAAGARTFFLTTLNLDLLGLLPAVGPNSLWRRRPRRPWWRCW